MDDVGVVVVGDLDADKALASSESSSFILLLLFRRFFGLSSKDGGTGFRDAARDDAASFLSQSFRTGLEGRVLAALDWASRHSRLWRRFSVVSSTVG